METLVHLLRSRVDQHPERVLYRFLKDGTLSGRVEAWTYQDVDRRARAIGATLSSRKLEGQRALLIYPPGLEYVAAFFGCLYAGVTAVPAIPPNPQRLERSLPRLAAIVRDCAPSAVLCDELIHGFADQISSGVDGLASLPWLVTEDLGDAGIHWEAQTVRGDDIAYLQYTSGSTADPKGVILRHRNLLHALEDNNVGANHDASSTTVSWVPNFHDLGLILGVLQPLLAGSTTVFMSPESFMSRPFNWVKAISDLHATHSSGPNFGFELCARKVSDEQAASLDLSSWRIAVMGGEPIRSATIRRFLDRFERRGLRRETLCPCYGMAEVVLKVTSVMTRGATMFAFDAVGLERDKVISASPGEDGARELTGCGWAGPATNVEIVDPTSSARAQSDSVGEIWVSSPSVASGYWNRPTESTMTFGAKLENDQRVYYRTGDLGFFARGELVPCGRLKDLIIIRGRNHYPHDIEDVVDRCHPAIRIGCSAAFSVDGPTDEEPVIVVEVRGDPPHDEVLRTIRTSVGESCGVQLRRIVLIPPQSILKTSSGKIQRLATKRALLASELEVLEVWEFRDPLSDPDALAEFLHDQFHAVLARGNLDEGGSISLTVPIIEMGFDSLMAVELRDRVERNLEITVPMADLADNPSIRELAVLLFSRSEAT